MTTVTTQEGRVKTASTVTTEDGTQVYFEDWGTGQPVVFCHGWPLNADAWQSQIFFLAQNGYRTLDHDRCGQGRSSQPSGGNDMDTYAGMTWSSGCRQTGYRLRSLRTRCVVAPPTPPTSSAF